MAAASAKDAAGTAKSHQEPACAAFCFAVFLKMPLVVDAEAAVKKERLARFVNSGHGKRILIHAITQRPV
jgi:hypothetical protein